MKVINIGKLRESNEQNQLVMGKDNSTRMLKATYHQQTANNSNYMIQKLMNCE